MTAALPVLTLHELRTLQGTRLCHNRHRAGPAAARWVPAIIAHCSGRDQDAAEGCARISMTACDKQSNQRRGATANAGLTVLMSS